MASRGEREEVRGRGTSSVSRKMVNGGGDDGDDEGVWRMAYCHRMILPVILLTMADIIRYSYYCGGYWPTILNPHPLIPDLSDTRQIHYRKVVALGTGHASDKFLLQYGALARDGLLFMFKSLS